MNPDEINKEYWSNVKPEQVLAGVHFPAEEFFDSVKTGSKILDVGCGAGKISEYLQGKGCLVTGIDINQGVLDVNKKRNPNITYTHADITQKLPFEDDAFDAIVVPYVLVSIIDLDKEAAAARELTRVLKTGGVLWICEATYSEDYVERYKKGKEATGLDGVALSLSKNPQSEGKVERVIRHYSPQELDALFSDLQKISSKEISVLSPNSGMTVKSVVATYKKS